MNYFLQSDRLGFRQWAADDLPLARELWGDPKVSEWFGGPFSEQAIRNRFFAEIEQQRTHGMQYWPIFLLADRKHVGCAGLRPKAESTLELGYHLKADYWGRGLATEAAAAVVEHAFGTLGVGTLFAGHHPSNAVSRNILHKLGFVYACGEFYEPSGLLEPTYLLRRHDWRGHPNKQNQAHPQSASAGQA